MKTIITGVDQHKSPFRVGLDRVGRTFELGLDKRDREAPIIVPLTLAEARVLLVELERQIEAAMQPRSPIINDDEPKAITP